MRKPHKERAFPIGELKHSCAIQVLIATGLTLWLLEAPARVWPWIALGWACLCALCIVMLEIQDGTVAGSLGFSLFAGGPLAWTGWSVQPLGYVDKAEMPGLYAGAAAFLYPAIYEGFGLPIVEAMASGTPVVTSTTGAAPEIAGGAAVLVDPFDVAAIEAGIEEVTQPAEAVRRRGLGLERIRLFDWGAAAEATIESYRRR